MSAGSPVAPEAKLDVKSNSEHIVDVSVTLGSIAHAVDESARRARDELKVVRENILSTSTVLNDSIKADVSNYNKSFTEIIDKLLPVDETVTTQRTITANVKDLLYKSLNNFVVVQALAQSQPPTSSPIAVTLDNVAVGFDKRRGTVDSFFTTLTFSIDKEDVKNVRAISIIRSKPVQAKSNHVISQTGLSRIASNTLSGLASTSIRNQDYISKFEKRLIENNVKNAVTIANPLSTLSNERAGSSRTLTATDLSKNNSTQANLDLTPFVNSSLIPSSIDRSVSNDINFIKNLQSQNPQIKTQIENSEISVGRYISAETHRMGQAHLDELASNETVDSTEIENLSEEIAFLPLKAFNITSFEKVIKCSFVDESVNIGNSYRYAVKVINNEMTSGPRSTFVEANITGYGVYEPSCPVNVTADAIKVSNHSAPLRISLSIKTNDYLTEKFEIYRRNVDLTKNSALLMIIPIVNSKDGYSIDEGTAITLSNGFIKIGEAANSLNSDALFFDNTAKPGERYTYRVFSVDVFGNKSSYPFEREFSMPDQTYHAVKLRTPQLSIEKDSKTGKVLVRINSEDDKVVSLFLARRDLTIGEKAFTYPSNVNEIKFGNSSYSQGSKKFEGPRLSENSSIAWTGQFKNTGNFQYFIDSSTVFDHTYQYQLHGIDKFGNKTSYALSKKFFLSRNASINSPISLKADMVFQDSRLIGLGVTWEDGNIKTNSDEQYSPIDLNILETKILYQVEKKRKGDPEWTAFSLTSNKSFLDKDIMPNETYYYSVQSLSSVSGSWMVSNRSFPIEAFTNIIPTPPTLVETRISPLTQSPLSVTISLRDSMFNSTAKTDYWEIQKCSANIYAAEKINKVVTNFMGKLEDKSGIALSSLPFNSFMRLHHETSDINGPVDYTDYSVEPCNSYYYRVRTVLTTGVVSDWFYIIVPINDPGRFFLINSTLTTTQRATLENTFLPLAFGNLVRFASVTPNSLRNPQTTFSSNGQTIFVKTRYTT